MSISLRESIRQYQGVSKQMTKGFNYPNFLHVIPVGDDAVLDGVFQSEDASLWLRLVTDIGVFLIHADHDLQDFG